MQWYLDAPRLQLDWHWEEEQASPPPRRRARPPAPVEKAPPTVFSAAQPRWWMVGIILDNSRIFHIRFGQHESLTGYVVEWNAAAALLDVVIPHDVYTSKGPEREERLVYGSFRDRPPFHMAAAGGGVRNRPFAHLPFLPARNQIAPSRHS